MELPVIETEVFSLAPEEGNEELDQLFAGGPISGITRALDAAKEGDLTYLTMGTAILAILAAACWIAFFVKRAKYNKKLRQLEELKRRQDRRRRWEEEDRRYRESQGADYDYDYDDDEDYAESEEGSGYVPGKYADDDSDEDEYTIDEDLESWADEDTPVEEEPVKKAGKKRKQKNGNKG